jgi:drug/metabolite transporter (DMT)-like permease
MGGTIRQEYLLLNNHQRYRFGKGDLAIISGSFMWAIGAIVIKNALGETPDTFRVFTFNELRMFLAAISMFAIVKFYGGSITVRFRDIPFLAGTSFIGMFVYMYLNLKGLTLTSVSNYGVIMATIPLFILFLASILRIEKVTFPIILGIFIGFLGTLSLSFQSGSFEFYPGDLFILASCLCWAAFTVMSKKIPSKYSPIVIMAWMFIFTCIFQLPFCISEHPEQSLTSISALNWFNFIIAAFISLLLGNVLFYYAVQEIGPSRVGLYSYLEPVFIIMLAVLLCREHISSLHIIGLTLIFTGIWISTRRSNSNSSFSKKEGA